MKKNFFLIMLLYSINTFSADWNPLETVDQARQRQSNENYEAYQKRDSNLIPPSYNRPLGDVQQPNVSRPGYVMPNQFQNNYQNDPFPIR